MRPMRRYQPHRAAFLFRAILAAGLITFLLGLIWWSIAPFLGRTFPLLGAFGFALVGIAWQFVLTDARWRRESVSIHADRIVKRTGGLASSGEVELALRNVTKLEVVRPFLEHRLFGTGTIRIRAAGSALTEVSLRHVEDSEAIYTSLQETLAESGFRMSRDRLLLQKEPGMTGALLHTGLSGLVSVVTALYLFWMMVVGFFALAQLPIDDMFSLFAAISADAATREAILAPHMASLSDSVSVGHVYGVLLLLTLLGVIGALATLAFAALRFLDLLQRTYRIYEDLIEYEDGFMTETRVVIPVENLSDVNRQEGLLLRVFGYGQVQISCQGAGNEVTLDVVPDVRDFAACVSHMMRGARELPGEQQAAVAPAEGAPFGARQGGPPAPSAQGPEAMAAADVPAEGAPSGGLAAARPADAHPASGTAEDLAGVGEGGRLIGGDMIPGGQGAAGAAGVAAGAPGAMAAGPQPAGAGAAGVGAAHGSAAGVGPGHRAAAGVAGVVPSRPARPAGRAASSSEQLPPMHLRIDAKRFLLAPLVVTLLPALVLWIGVVEGILRPMVAESEDGLPIAAVLGVGVFVIMVMTAFPLLGKTIVKVFTKYEVSGRSVRTVFDLISRTETEFGVEKITAVSFVRGPLDHLMGTATVRVYSIGSAQAQTLQAIRLEVGVEEGIRRRLGLPPVPPAQEVRPAFSFGSWVSQVALIVFWWPLVMALAYGGLWLFAMAEGIEAQMMPWLHAKGVPAGLLLLAVLLLISLVRDVWLCRITRLQKWQDAVGVLRGVIVQTQTLGRLEHVRHVRSKRYAFRPDGALKLTYGGGVTVGVPYLAAVEGLHDAVDRRIEEDEPPVRPVPGEVRAEGRRHLGHDMAGSVVPAIVFLPLAPVVLVLRAIGSRRTRYRVEEGRVMSTWGVWHRYQASVVASRVDHTKVDRGPLSLLFGTGDVAVHTTGGSGADLRLENTPQYERLRGAIQRELVRGQSADEE